MGLLILIAIFSYCCGFSTEVAAKELNVICDIWPPYQVKTSTHLSGYSVKILKAVATQMKVKIEIHDYPWKRAIHMMRNHEADGVLSINPTEDREKFLQYPKEPLIKTPWVLWTKTDSKIKYNTFNDLIDFHGGVVRGYSYTDDFWKFLKTKGSYTEIRADILNFKKLAANRIDYTVAELRNGSYIIKNLKSSNIHPILNKPIKKDTLYIGFSKKRVSQEFVNLFSNTLKKFKKTETYRKILSQETLAAIEK